MKYKKKNINKNNNNKSNNKLLMKIDIQTYWHASTGRGAGYQLDAMVHKDPNGIPCLPGKTLKGLLRDVCFRAEQWGQIPAGGCDWLFGSRTDHHRFETVAGKLIVNDACLPDDMVDWLARREQKSYRQYLFDQLYSTAVDHETGSAKDKSLRGIEVAIPMTLYSGLSVRDTHNAPQDWKKLLATGLPLLRAVGAYRSRGLGRVSCTLQEVRV